jgi:hypothetical protein
LMLAERHSLPTSPSEVAYAGIRQRLRSHTLMLVERHSLPTSMLCDNIYMGVYFVREKKITGVAQPLILKKKRDRKKETKRLHESPSH